MTMSDHLHPDAVLLDLPARTKADVLKRLAGRAAEALGRDAAAIARVLGDRERLGSTGVGSGVALPHAVLDGLDEPFVMFARLVEPVDWEAIDDVPVDLVAVVLSPAGGGGASSSHLAKFARALRNGDTRARLRRCVDIDAVGRTLAEAGG